MSDGTTLPPVLPTAQEYISYGRLLQATDLKPTLQHVRDELQQLCDIAYVAVNMSLSADSNVASTLPDTDRDNVLPPDPDFLSPPDPNILSPAIVPGGPVLTPVDPLSVSPLCLSTGPECINFGRWLEFTKVSSALHAILDQLQGCNALAAVNLSPSAVSSTLPATDREILSPVKRVMLSCITDSPEVRSNCKSSNIVLSKSSVDGVPEMS
ncbi:hypothetical protein H0H93_009389 [Arthromyces matolae]|nr:hypothetical protein H0H93_009389 [Arthromyces matolae]